jgi:hypothetical protein
MPPGDLCDELRVSRREAAESGVKPCTASNEHLRMLVGGWMLGDGKEGMLKARALYERHGMLDAPGVLSDAIIAREVMMLLDRESEE